MPHRSKPYPNEFREELVALARSGRSLRALAREFDVALATLSKWVRQASIDEGDAPGATSNDQAELKKLRAENARLREERDILKKAAAWFAQETLKKTSSDS